MKERTCYCGEVTEAYLNETITVMGWVQKRRDLGGLVFIDLRDREGILQLTIPPEASDSVWQAVERCRTESVICATGTVVMRDVANPKLKTGAVELNVTSLDVLNESKVTPFVIEEADQVNDELRMTYRYLDLRRVKMQETLKLRHHVTHVMRSFLNDHRFIDVETPYLTKSTPEGARDYLVPSRVYPGHFYALPQSPQILKQLLMNAGVDRYYQIVRCFRDEDLRGDRQPEFTQLDLETSFLSEQAIRDLTEALLKTVVKETKGIELSEPFPVLSYDEAMNRFGSDKPDLRFGLELQNISDWAQMTDFKVFKETISQGGIVSALVISKGADRYSRKDLDQKAKDIETFNAKGLAWVKVTSEGISGPIAKFLDAKSLCERLNAKEGDLICFVADQKRVVQESLGYLRIQFAKELALIDPDQLAFAWIVDWPLLEFDEEANRYVAAHHPFTRPKEEHISLLKTHPDQVYAQAYDIVLNGYEIGGGSLRIYQRELQEQMFDVLGFTKEEAEAQFGFLLEAMDYGFPPHGGIALGLDRIVMILAGADNIREVIAFPKNSKAVDPMLQAPSTVSNDQLDVLQIALVNQEQDHTE